MKWLFYAFLISLPLGTRLLLHQFINGFHEYEAAFLYLSDILLIAFLAWFVFCFITRTSALSSAKIFSALFGVAAILSAFFAFSSVLAAYNVARLILLLMAAFAVARLVREKIVTHHTIFAILAGSAVFQALLGIAQFLKQSSLGLKLLGESVLGADIPGAAKIIAEGVPILRSYGTFPHPNVLAAFLIIGLLSLYYFWLKRPSPATWFSGWGVMRSDILIGLGIAVVSGGLLFAFSRTAWVISILATFAILLLSFRRHFRQNVRLIGLCFSIFILFFAIFHPYIFPRAQISATEPAVVQRLTYNEMGFHIIRNNFFGVGIGNQVLHAVKNNVYQEFGMDQVWQWQPIHNIYILIASEIGQAGLIFFLIFIARIFFSWKGFESWISKAMLASLLLFGFFDHFLWTLQPGRLMLWVVIGLVLVYNRSVLKV